MVKYLSLIIVVIGLSFFVSKSVQSQTTITCQSGLSIQTLIADTLINGCTTVSGITVNSSGAYGYFRKNNSQFPFVSGVIIASGAITNAQGPNTSGSSGSSLGSGSDPDLVEIAGGGSIYDATVVQFDFVPADDTVEFRYVFGSEEFPEYANSNFNDVFGFFLSGPGISGPYLNNAVNIALLPNGQTVTINNVHNYNYYTATPGSQSNSAGSYYGAVQYDGNTIVLVARAVVQPCQTYHIKLAVGDRGDSAFDSGVFFETNSFVSGAMIEGFNQSQFGGDSDLWEGCENMYIISRAPGASTSEALTINLSIGSNSTATPGTDYTTFPTQITIPAGQMTDTIFYNAYNDGFDEGHETILLNFYTTCPCGNMPSIISDTIWVFDAQRIKGGIQDVQTDYCGIAPPSSLTLHASCNLDTSQVTNVYYHWSTGSNTNSTTIVPQPGATTYYVTMFDDCGNEVYDSITVRVSSMTVANTGISHASCHNECDGSYIVNASNNFPPFTYSYVNTQYIWFPDSTHVQSTGNFQNLCPGTYLVTVTDAIGCQILSEFTINNLPPINHSLGIVEGNQTFCSSPGNITLHAQANQESATFQWFNSTTQSSATFTPAAGENNYWVRIYDACGNMFEDAVSVTVSLMQATASSSDDNGTCNGQAWVNASGGISPYTFYWPQIQEFGANQYELCYGMYTVNITDNIGCELTRQTYVQLNTAILDSENTLNVVYPNPNTGGFMVNLGKFPSTEYRICMYDIVGKCIYDITSTGNGIIHVEDISSGTYFLNVTSNGEMIFSEKVVIIEN
ncbi:MAG TPA: choice-of-anchor L domain-containing protein [Bacteroidales bacterium]|nr:choice-of-anchor L domain-containing protein [Bacteroidales bacterium]